MGRFMEYALQHPYTISFMLNLQTCSVSPQYHLVHCDWFSTVSCVLYPSLTPELWDQLISTGYKREFYETDGAVWTIRIGGPCGIRT